MDTTTVLEMIKQLNSCITFYNVFEVDEHNTDAYKQAVTDPAHRVSYLIGKRDGLKEFRDHLQSFIEAQVNVIENQTRE